jgi:dihydropyrimidine dehydrogenase (NAD+) subunit PreA
MTDLAIEFCGVKAPNPFWLASAPPTNSAYQVRRAFDAGWGGVVWKTLGSEPIVNVSSRYGAIDYDGRKVAGLNNIELITDRTLEDNLREIAEVKRDYPQHAHVRVADGRTAGRSLARHRSPHPGRRAPTGSNSISVARTA